MNNNLQIGIEYNVYGIDKCFIYLDHDKCATEFEAEKTYKIPCEIH